MKQSEKPSRRSWWRGPRAVMYAGREEGGALYEFAMVLPILATMLVAIIYGGITFYNYVELTNAVEAGGLALENSRSLGASACTNATTAITNSVGNLNASQLVTGTVTFAGTSVCGSAPLQYDTGIVSAVYPCNLPIPFTSLNLCPLASGGNVTVSFNGTQHTLASCPYSHCISATNTVSIE